MKEKRVSGGACDAGGDLCECDAMGTCVAQLVGC